MDLIKNNPYRIAGILSNATQKDIERQRGKIKAYARVGKTIKSEYDFPILETITRTEGSIEKAFANIQQNQDKVNYALFWFLNSNPFDNTAIDYLKNGNGEKAVEIWEKVTLNKEVSSKNFSAFNNLGTCKLLSQVQDEIREGIEVKIKLIESDNFEDFVHSVADEYFKIDNEKQIEKLVDELLTQLKSQYSSSETLQLFTNCNGSTQKHLSQKFTEEPIYKIESQIESTKKKRKENKSGAYELGLNLYTKCKDDLSILKTLLGANDLKYRMLVDQLANEIMQCGIDFFNESQEKKISNDYFEPAMKLVKLAESIARGKLTKDRAKDSLITLEEMKDEGLLQAINLLQSVKAAYVTSEATIRRQIKELEETDVEIKLGLKTINQSAIEDSFAKDSINWKEVNNLLNAVLDDNNLEKIKQSSNNQLKADFIELANWLKEKSMSNSTITSIINKYKKIPPKLSFKILSSEITNTDNKPLYTKFIRYIGLNLNIQVTEDASVIFYIKYINPNGSIKRNSDISPLGYTRSEIKILNTHTNKIQFPGWGNADKCTYDIGEHCIEIYVDEYLIHSKTYIVDLVPSEKLMNKLKQAENNLNKIENTQYFKSDFEIANFEMSEIQKFKLFRGSSEKQRQVESQHEKFSLLKEKSEKEKKKNIKTQEERIYKLKMELSAAKY